jgi:hypothetical protein
MQPRVNERPAIALANQIALYVLERKRDWDANLIDAIRDLRDRWREPS